MRGSLARAVPATPARPPLPRPVWLLSWVSFFADVSSEMVYPLLPLFLVTVLGSSRAQLGAIEGLAAIAVAGVTIGAGARSDRTSKRVPWIRAGYGLPVAGKIIIALASVWHVALAGRLLDRAGKGLRSAPRDALISDCVGHDQRGRAFGLHRAFDTAGAMIGVLLAGALMHALADRGDPHAARAYRVSFAVAAGLGLIAMLLTFAVREPDGPGRVIPSNPDPDARALPRSYWRVLGLLTLFSLGNSSDTFLLLRASDLGLTPVGVVMAYAGFNLVYAAMSYPAGALSDRLGRWGMLAAGWTLYAAAYGAIAFLDAQRAWMLWPIMIVYGGYMALTDGVAKALIADHSPPGARGRAMGYYHACAGIAMLGASLAAGIVWDRAGAKPAFLVGAAFAMLAVLAIPIVRAAPAAAAARSG